LRKSVIDTEVWRSGEIDVRRDGICLYLNPADRAKLEEIVANRNSPRKWVWRAEIVLATADGLGTNAIMRGTGKSKPCVWRWQERYIDEKAYPADSGSSIFSRCVDLAWLWLLCGLSRLMMSQ
jgi:hypothetical protein